MKLNKLIMLLVLCFLTSQLCTSQKKQCDYTEDTKTKVSNKIIKGGSIEMLKGRRAHDLGERDISTKHFVVRITTPENPFKPHKHVQSELWFITSAYSARFWYGTCQ